MLALTRVAEAHLLLETLHLESVAVVLVGVATVARNEAVESCNETTLAAGVCEVEALEVLDESVGGLDLEGLDLAAIVVTAGGIELRASGMGDNFAPAGRGAFFCAGFGGFVVIAFDAEDEVGAALPHAVVERLVVRQLLEVEEVLADGTAEDP